MQVIKSDKVVMFDADDTLIRWGKRVIPGSEAGEEITYIDSNNVEYTYHSIAANIQALITHKSRGHTVIVWSAGGYQWAQDAVEILGLQPFVDYVMSKPAWAYDDLPAERILTRVMYAKDSDYGLGNTTGVTQREDKQKI